MAQPRALTRSGSWTPDKAFEMLKPLFGNTASASPDKAAYSRGKTEPKDVDNARFLVQFNWTDHLQVVLQEGIDRLIVVSSASVTRPYAPVGLLLNTLTAQMQEMTTLDLNKFIMCQAAVADQGENQVKELFQGSSCDSYLTSSYTIVRPGGLTKDPADGFLELQFNQGDTYVGNVSRADVAAVCAVAATDPLNSGAGKTFEMFKARTRQPLLPWYRGKTRYVVGGNRDCAAMLARLRPDKEVYDVPGMLPISLADFKLGLPEK
ncbi:unnamed protein product [Symbiodinium natans]|uniref:NAD(P)-binding domain-containing protein n=1 Tax=Symbiodinium natans TaxID=878477 RepID=A0A812PSR1_9DINO|nr:unnamed protein product [Symbiodinium natans]